MKSFVTQTYFHLMRAIAMALTLEEKPMLYIITDYMGVKEDMVERIRETQVFADVTPIDYQEFLAPFISDLRQTSGMSAKDVDVIGDSIFERHLTPYFAGVFENADKDDDIYVFNDLGWYYYYVERNFRTVVGVEDSYEGFDQYLKIATYQGNAERLFPFVGKYYPPHHFKSEKVKGIISSCELPGIGPPYEDKITVSDYIEVSRRNGERFKRALLHIFNVEQLEIEPGSTLYLTQPLSRASYCTALENYLINKKLLREELKTAAHIYIKPHPADDFDYQYFESDRVILLPQKMPSEILGMLGVRFARSIAFDSRTVVHEDYIDEHVALYNPKRKSRTVFEKFLSNYVRGEKLTVDLYYKMPELSPENYLGFFSYPVRHPQIDFRLIALVPGESAQAAKEFLSAASFRDNKKRYVAESIGKGGRRHRRMIARLARANLRRAADGHVRVLPAETEGGSLSYLKDIIKSDDGAADYFMLIDQRNVGNEAVRLFSACVRKRMPFVFALSSSYQSDGKTVPLQCEAVNGCVSGIVSHKMWQRKLIDECGARAEIGEDAVEERALHYQSVLGTYFRETYVSDTDDYLLEGDAEAKLVSRLNAAATRANEGYYRDREQAYNHAAAIIIAHLNRVMVTDGDIVFGDTIAAVMKTALDDEAKDEILTRVYDQPRNELRSKGYNINRLEGLSLKLVRRAPLVKAVFRQLCRAALSDQRYALLRKYKRIKYGK